MTVRQTIWEAKEQNTGFLPYSLLVNVPSWRPLNQVKKDTEAVYIIKVPEYWQTTKNNCACVFSDENLCIFLTLLCQGAALTWVRQMRYQPISFRRGGKNCSLAMKIHHFKGLIYFLYSVILVLGAFLQHIRSLQTPVSLWLIYNNITICSSFHLLHQATKLNYQVRKKMGKPKQWCRAGVSGAATVLAVWSWTLQKLGALGAAHAQPTQGSTGQWHLHRIYRGNRPQVQAVFPSPPYSTLNNVVDVMQHLHIEDFYLSK